jgi:hypothetical protein
VEKPQKREQECLPSTKAKFFFLESFFSTIMRRKSKAGGKNKKVFGWKISSFSSHRIPGAIRRLPPTKHLN